MEAVSYKRGSLRVNQRWDSFPFGGRNRNLSAQSLEMISFYVSKFPESSSAKDLFELFGCVGNVVEVSIAP